MEEFYEDGQNGFLGYREGRIWSGEGMSVTYPGVSEYWLQEYMGFLAMGVGLSIDMAKSGLDDPMTYDYFLGYIYVRV